ncbi:MAG TPA: TetR family transcriptional regulator, partial [Methyloversatilis sp.]
LSMLQVVFEAAVRCGQLPAHMPVKETAEAMHAFIGGLMRSWIERRDFDLHKSAPWLVDTFLTGLKNAPQPDQNQPN